MPFWFAVSVILSLFRVDNLHAGISRKYPQGGGCDTLLITPGKKIRGAHQLETPLFADEEIIKIFTDAARKRVISDGAYHIEFAVPKPGKHVIQQLGFRGCTAAATAMLIVDHEKTPNLSELYHRNLGNEPLMMEDLTRAGLQPRLAPIGTVQGMSPDSLARQIEINGPAILSISGEIGGHVIIVDQVDLRQQAATIRDPYHGWMITISLSSLMSRVRAVPCAIIQVVR